MSPASLFLALAALPNAATRGDEGEPNASQSPPRTQVAQRFEQADRDSDGRLDREEWKSIAPRDRDAVIFLRVDANSDGFVSRDEAGAAREKLRTRFAGDAVLDADSMRVQRDVVYVERTGFDPKLTSLDIFAPKEGSGFPVVVMIHGGGWKGGDKRFGAASENKANFFVEHGCVFASINYRLSPAVKHPAHVEDVAAAIAWIHDHARDHGGDPDLLFVMGHSAGAHLAALVAVDERRLAKHQKSLSTVKGVILLDGAGYDIARTSEWTKRIGRLPEMYADAFGAEEDGWKDASPISYLEASQGIAPALVFYTGREDGPRARTIQDFASAWAGTGVFCEAIATDQDHAAINREFGNEGDRVTQRSLEFVMKLVEGRKAALRN